MSAETSIDLHARPGFVIGRTAYLFRTRIIGALRSVASPLNPEEAWILMVLTDFGGSARTGDLNLTRQRDASTLTRQLDSLTRKGMVTRARDAEDGRIINVTLTRKGRGTLAKVHPSFKSLRQGAVAGISKADLKTTITTLLKIQQNLLF